MLTSESLPYVRELVDRRMNAIDTTTIVRCRLPKRLLQNGNAWLRNARISESAAAKTIGTKLKRTSIERN